MIDPQFLAQLRHQHRSETLLTMMQLEQIIPCDSSSERKWSWHESITDLALEIGTDRASLNRCLRRLEKLGLIKYHSISNHGGTWVWWVKRHPADTPNPKDEPGWDLRMTTSSHTVRIPVSKREEWAKARGIPLPTLYGFLQGRQKVLRNQWRLIRSPFDVEIVD